MQKVKQIFNVVYFKFEMLYIVNGGATLFTVYLSISISTLITSVYSIIVHFIFSLKVFFFIVLCVWSEECESSPAFKGNKYVLILYAV